MTNILLLVFILGRYYSLRSSAPSPVPTSTILLSTACSTPPPQIVTPLTPQTIPTSSAPCMVETFMARSVERRNRLQQPMTRSEHIRFFGRRSYESWKWKWDGAARGERR